ncbi:hypothetical protein [Achromobacter insuavis]|uniref:hypothetical protein n=1 Tax=Achromobacter insuavis TaxID=1287735 RepID=UPI0015D1D286|nr:hypothetical protein [Achromobacter insuavis]
MADLARERAFQRIGPAGGSKVESPLDLICKEHDLAYLEAESQSGSEAMQKFEADKDLLIKIAALDENLLTKDEKSYVKLMTAAFAAKICAVDFPALFDEGLMTAIKDLMLSVHGLLDGIDGLSYMDQFGAMIWGAVNEGDLHGGFGDQEFWDIPFTRFTLIATDTAGAGAVISYYEDPYREAHGIAAVVAGEIVEGSSRTITLYDGGFVTAQSGQQAPVVLAEPSTMAWPGLYLDDFQVFPDVIPVRPPAAASAPPASDPDPDMASMPIPSIIDIGPITSHPLPSVPLPSLPEPTAPPEEQSAPPDRTDGGPFYAVLVDPPFPDDGTGLRGPPPPPIVVHGSPVNDWINATWDLFQCDSPDFFTKTFCDGLLRDAYPMAIDWAGELSIRQDLNQLVTADSGVTATLAQGDFQSGALLSDTGNAWLFEEGWAVADAGCALVGNNLDDVGW